MSITKENVLTKVLIIPFQVLDCEFETRFFENDEQFHHTSQGFSLKPGENVSENSFYQSLNEEGKTRIDNITNGLWTDSVISEFNAYVAEQNALTE